MSKNISANILLSSILEPNTFAPNTVAGVSVKLNEAKSNILKYNQDLRITDNTVTSLTSRKSALDVNLQRYLDDLKFVTINLDTEQIKLNSALNLLEINKSTLATLVDYDTELQDNYYILSNDKYFYLNDIKTREEDIILFQKAYDNSVVNRNITLKNIKFYEDSINSNSQGLQLLKVLSSCCKA